MRAALARYSGEPRIFDCPSLDGGWTAGAGGSTPVTVSPSATIISADIPTRPAPASAPTPGLSPQRTTDDPTLVLVADLNVFCHSFQRILAPHSAAGPIVRDEAYFEANPGAIEETPRHIGAQGGNVGLLTGRSAGNRFSRCAPIAPRSSGTGRRVWTVVRRGGRGRTRGFESET
jgi:hypothetical protein